MGQCHPCNLTLSPYITIFQYIKDASACKRPLLNLHGQIQMEYLPPSFTIPPNVITLPLISSPLTLQYLGQYNRLFDNPKEQHVPT